MKRQSIARTMNSSRILGIQTNLPPKRECANQDAKNKRNRFMSQSPLITKVNVRNYRSSLESNAEVEKNLDFNILPVRTIHEKMSEFVDFGICVMVWD